PARASPGVGPPAAARAGAAVAPPAGASPQSRVILRHSPQTGASLSPDARRCPSCQKPLPEEGAFCPHCGLRTPTEPGVPARTAPTGAHEISRLTRALADRYRIERVLGEGGMATVYLAEDLKHHRRVAVKVMRPELAETLGAERFLR